MPFSMTESTFLFFVSAVLSSVVITNAYWQKQQFYPSVVYITKSNASMGIIYLQGLIVVLLIGKLIGRIFFGQLRTAEIEHLIERAWYALTETCLAFTVFRDDLSPKFVALFTLLLFLKCFHWLAEDRVDYMERSPNISIFFHIRVISLLSILGILDVLFVYLAYHSTLTKGASVQLVFGFEYAILFAIIINISMKYILHFFDLYNENPWEDKPIYLLYTELVMGFLKIVLYFIFIFIMVKIHTFPLFALRPMYLALRGFKKALNDVIMSRRAIRNMNAFYPDATPQDIENSDNVCIICRETMQGNGTCKKLPCNHIFHISCLRSWFQRQQTCPTCRMDVLRVNLANTNLAAGAAAMANDNQPNNNQQQNNQNDANMNQENGANNINRVPPIQPPPFLFQNFQQFIQRQQQNSENQNRNSTTNTEGNSNEGAGNRNSTAAPSANTNQFPTVSPLVIPPSIFAALQTPPFPMPQMRLETFLQGFSDDELRNLEGQSRQQLEARIKCLMDTKTLVTAALIRLQQYNCAVLNCKPTNSVSTQTEDLPSTTAMSNSTSSQMESSSQIPGPTLIINGSDRNINNQQQRDNEDEMIRQRRLQRFTQQQSSSLK